MGLRDGHRVSETGISLIVEAQAHPIQGLGGVLIGHGNRGRGCVNPGSRGGGGEKIQAFQRRLRADEDDGL